jgi:hypothetical protein
MWHGIIVRTGGEVLMDTCSIHLISSPAVPRMHACLAWLESATALKALAGRHNGEMTITTTVQYVVGSRYM